MFSSFHPFFVLKSGPLLLRSGEVKKVLRERFIELIGRNYVGLKVKVGLVSEYENV